MEHCLPSKPERPLDSDCCGQGCDPCVLDIYAEEVKIWEEECHKILTGERKELPASSQQENKYEPCLSSTEYNNFTIESIETETADSYRFTFRLPGGTMLGLRTGQHVVIRGDVAGETVSRQYTPVSDVRAKSFFQLLIKIYETGRMSEYLKTWTVGSSIQIRGPCGNFEYKVNKYRKVYMLAVGTGIAPMSQVIQTVLNCAEDETMATLLYGCRTYQDILLKKELDEWVRYWNFSCTYCLTQGSDDKNCYRYGDNVQLGQITGDLVQSVITHPQDNILVLICGTRSFERDMIQCMKDIGMAESQYHKF